MGKITRDMIGGFNQRLSAQGSPWRIQEREYEGAGYSTQVMVDTINPTLAPMLVDQVKYTNGTDLEQQVTLKVDKGLTMTHSFAVTNHVKIGTAVSFEFSIGIVTTNASLNLEYARDETATETKEETFTLSFEQPLKVPPRSLITMQTLIQVQTVTDLPFTLHVGLNDGVFAVTPKDIVPLHRYLQTNLGDHFYTTNYDELREGGGEWVKEGVACHISSSQGPGMVPLYRYLLDESRYHFYTTNYNELGAEGLESTQGFVFPSQAPGTVPLHRYQSDQDGHLYTTWYGELGGGRDGWRYEGVQAYVLPTDLNDPALLRGVRELFPNEADRRFVIPGHYRGQSTNRNIDVLVRQQPLPPDSPLRGKVQTKRTPEANLATTRVLQGKQVRKASPGELVNLTTTARD